MNFSIRHDYVKKPPQQMESMDVKLHHSLWLTIEQFFEAIEEKYWDERPTKDIFRNFLDYIWTEFFHLSKKESILIPSNVLAYQEIKARYNQLSWHEVYSFLEFVMAALNDYSGVLAALFKSHCNMR